MVCEDYGFSTKLLYSQILLSRTYCTSAYQDFIVVHHLPSKGLFPYH